MATNVFGNPVTDDTVRLIHPDITTVTAKDRAAAALQYMNAEDKATNVSKFVHNLKASYGTGTSTLGMIYNATGGNLSFLLNHSWAGHVWESPYPLIIQNGQWAGFLHVRGRLIGPCKEAIVYKGHTNNGDAREWMVAWYTPRQNFSNHVCADVGMDGEFETLDWDSLENWLENQSNTFTITQSQGYASASIGEGSSPEFVGIMLLEGLVTADDAAKIFPSLDSKYEDVVDEEAADDDEKAATT